MIKSLELDRITYEACLDLLKKYDEDTYNIVKDSNYTNLIKHLSKSNTRFYGIAVGHIQDKIADIIKKHDLSDRQIKSLCFMLNKLLIR